MSTRIQKSIDRSYDLALERGKLPLPFLLLVLPAVMPLFLMVAAADYASGWAWRHMDVNYKLRQLLSEVRVVY